MPFVPDQPKGSFKADKPEQGNMYTQGAEEIVYDANGVPLYTSSYGSAPTGGTETARKVLTDAAALPISVATGVARGSGAARIPQLVGNILGNNVGEQGVKALGQIERGMEQQGGEYLQLPLIHI